MGDPIPEAKYTCPVNGCTKLNADRKSYRQTGFQRLPDLLQHMAASHKVRQRWLIIDRKENKVYVTDTPLGKLSVDKLREEAPKPPEPRQVIEVPAAAA